MPVVVDLALLDKREGFGGEFKLSSAPVVIAGDYPSWIVRPFPTFMESSLRQEHDAFIFTRTKCLIWQPVAEAHTKNDVYIRIDDADQGIAVQSQAAVGKA
jgi:hypothetical protein